MSVLDWLLDSDPSIRWQVLQDLADAPPEVVGRERARVTGEGGGARILAYPRRLQAPDHTLTDTEVAAVRQACIDAAAGIGARLRG